ncbi:MAG: hypothetical protein HY929_06890 [Euryarchaeota archaeon]|nr:hypothetical protein [Euryarchaeota archaeon]
MKYKRIIAITVLFILAFGFTLGAGFYRASKAQSEAVHFRMNFPAAKGMPVGMGMYPGASPGKVEVYVSKQGLPKSIFCPQIVEVGTHELRNKGKKPYTIQLVLVNCTIPFEWVEGKPHVPWVLKNKSTIELEKPILPNQRMGIDIEFHIPQGTSSGVIYSGGLKVIDVETKKELAFLPITVILS